jgi:hypothetical protein
MVSSYWIMTTHYDSSTWTLITFSMQPSKIEFNHTFLGRQVWRKQSWLAFIPHCTHSS